MQRQSLLAVLHFIWEVHKRSCRDVFYSKPVETEWLQLGVSVDSLAASAQLGGSGSVFKLVLSFSLVD